MENEKKVAGRKSAFEQIILKKGDEIIKCKDVKDVCQILGVVTGSVYYAIKCHGRLLGYDVEAIKK